MLSDTIPKDMQREVCEIVKHLWSRQLGLKDRYVYQRHLYLLYFYYILSSTYNVSIIDSDILYNP